MEFLEHQFDSPFDGMEDLRNGSNQVWKAFKLESTPAEFATMELIWEAFECRSDIVQGNWDKLQILAISLDKRIPFDGLDANDISWEALHATLLTVRVNFPFKLSNDIGLSSAFLSHISMSIEESPKLNTGNNNHHKCNNHSLDNLCR